MTLYRRSLGLIRQVRRATLEFLEKSISRVTPSNQFFVELEFPRSVAGALSRLGDHGEDKDRKGRVEGEGCGGREREKRARLLSRVRGVTCAETKKTRKKKYTFLRFTTNGVSYFSL